MCQETDIHVLFEYQIAVSAWREVGFPDNISILPEDSVYDVIRRVFDRGNREQCTMLALVCWIIWNRRNKWVWDK